MKYAIILAALLASGSAMGQSLGQPTTGITGITTDAAASVANGCPADRPIAKRIASQWRQCTLMACVPKLVCPSDPVSKGMLGDADCYYSQVNDCNTCTSDITTQCFSEQEIQGAAR